jgi:hypothetical protein
VRRRTERQDGLSNSILNAKIAEQLFRMEDDGLELGGERVVPREKRV